MLRYKVDTMRNPAILVIDDDREVGQALTAMLGELGHEVEYYPEGAEGLERVDVDHGPTAG
jgi:CheY-like chemotaxis protein